MGVMTNTLRTGALLSLALLAGCSMFSSKKPRVEPAPLVSFKPSMNVRTVWTAEVGKAGSYFLAPALADGKVFAAATDGKIIAIDAASGKNVWTTTVDADISAGVGADAGTVAVASAKGTLFAFDAATGKERWKIRLSTEVLSAPAVGSGVVVVRSMDNKIAAYDVESGNRRWVVQRTAPALVLRAAPGIVINDGIAYVALPAGRLLALSASTGRRAARRDRTRARRRCVRRAGAAGSRDLRDLVPGSHCLHGRGQRQHAMGA